MPNNKVFKGHKDSWSPQGQRCIRWYPENTDDQIDIVDRFWWKMMVTDIGNEKSWWP